MGKCPAHKDDNPSLAITEKNGKILVHCHGGCQQKAVITELINRDLWPSKRKYDPIVAEYNYTDKNGKLIYRVTRYEPPGERKYFLQSYPDGSGGWIWKKSPHQVLYHLREVLEAPIVFVVEGEKDVETLREHGFVATTNAGGAKAPWLPSFTGALIGREVILIPDNDPEGQNRVVKIAKALRGHAAKIIILQLDGVKDVTDWFSAGHSETDLIERVEGEVYQ
jgi:putative DNA primase/helicase